MKLQMAAYSLAFDFKSIESKIYTYFYIYLQSSFFFMLLKWGDRQYQDVQPKVGSIYLCIERYCT